MEKEIEELIYKFQKMEQDDRLKLLKEFLLSFRYEYIKDSYSNPLMQIKYALEYSTFKISEYLNESSNFKFTGNIKREIKNEN